MRQKKTIRNRRILGELLRELRESAGLKQSDVASRLQQTQSFVSKWEAGQRRVDVLQLRAFCDAAGVSLGRFVVELESRLES
ncbi:MAG: transcriptional regulator [Planctomycetaceae bacterium]|nr:transcriptional regulator [Planctomycetaceae bacterium]